MQSQGSYSPRFDLIQSLYTSFKTRYYAAITLKIVFLWLPCDMVGFVACSIYAWISTQLRKPRYDCKSGAFPDHVPVRHEAQSRWMYSLRHTDLIWCMHVFVTWSTVKSRPHQKDMKKTFILLPNILQRPVTVLEKKRRQVWPASFDWWKSQDGCWEGLDGFGIYDRYPVAPSVLAYMLKPEIVVLQLRPDPSPANLECPTVARARSLPCLFPAKRGSWKMVSWNPATLTCFSPNFILQECWNFNYKY